MVDVPHEDEVGWVPTESGSGRTTEKPDTLNQEDVGFFVTLTRDFGTRPTKRHFSKSILRVADLSPLSNLYKYIPEARPDISSDK